MKRTHKLLSLVTAGTIAMAIIGASSAAAVEFHSESASTTIEGVSVSTHIFKTAAGEIKCNGTFKGTASAATVADVTIMPIYTSCLALGESGHVTVSAGCAYTFTKPTSATMGPVDVVGCGTSSISITVTVFGSSICTMTIGNQTGIGNVDYLNQGAGTSRDVLVTSTVTAIDYVVDGGGGFCGSTGLHTDGTYTGTTTVKGFTNGKQVGIFVS